MRGLQIHVSKLLLVCAVAAIAATAAVVVAAYMDSSRPRPSPRPDGGMPPPPPPSDALIICVGLLVLTWLAVLVVLSRDQILHRIAALRAGEGFERHDRAHHHDDEGVRGAAGDRGVRQRDAGRDGARRGGPPATRRTAAGPPDSIRPFSSPWLARLARPGAPSQPWRRCHVDPPPQASANLSFRRCQASGCPLVGFRRVTNVIGVLTNQFLRAVRRILSDRQSGDGVDVAGWGPLPHGWLGASDAARATQPWGPQVTRRDATLRVTPFARH